MIVPFHVKEGRSPAKPASWIFPLNFSSLNVKNGFFGFFNMFKRLFPFS